MLVSWITNGIVDAHTHGLVEEAVEPLKKEGFLPSDYKMPEEPHEVVEAVREHADDRILTFDCECIENDDDYATLLRVLAEHAGADTRISGIASELDYEQKKARLSFTIDGESVQREWKQDSDWVAEPFFELLHEVFPERFASRFVFLPAQDQCAEIILMQSPDSKDVATTFDRLSGQVDIEEVANSKITANATVAILGLLATTGGGWVLFGFWKALAVSLMVWIVVFFRGCSQAIREQDEQMALAKQVEENPEVITEMAMEFLDGIRRGKKKF